MEPSYQRWDCNPELTDYLDSVTFTSFPDSSAVLLLVGSGGSPILKITFPHTQAIAAYEETTHWLINESDADLPQLKQGGAYPMLIVRDSAWAKSFSELRRGMREEPPAHYLVVTLNNYVDVLSYAEPLVEQEGPEAWERLFGNVAP